MEEAVGYVRISDDGAGAGLGVKRQKKDLHALAEKLNKRLVRIYEDNDVSAFTGKKRADYEQMIAGIRAGERGHQCVLAWHTDRIHRTTRELDDYIDASEIHNTVTHTYQAGLIDLSTPGGQAMARTMATFAQYESAIKRERLKAWSRQHAERGKNPGGIRPYGWSAADRTKLDPDEHRIIQEIAGRLLAGESLRAIVASLNSRMVPTGTWHPPLAWKEWSSTVVRSMMLRPRLAGWRVHNGEIVTRGEWEPALDETTWQRVRTLLTEPGRQTGGRGARVNLLTGLAVCGHCDQPVTIQYGGPNRPEKSRNAYGCSGCGVWRAQPAVDGYVKGAAVRALKKMSTPTDPGDDPVVVAKIARLRARITAVMEEFADDDDISPEEQRTIVRRLKDRLEVEQRKLKPSKAHVLQGKTGDNADWDSWTLDVRRAVVDALFEVRIYKAGPGRRVFRPETVQLVLR